MPCAQRLCCYHHVFESTQSHMRKEKGPCLAIYASLHSQCAAICSSYRYAVHAAMQFIWPSHSQSKKSSALQPSINQVMMPAALAERRKTEARIMRRHSSQAGLSLRGLNIFTPNHALHLCRSLDLTLQAGNSLLIVGPSGCGKSSMLRAIAGIRNDLNCSSMPQVVMLPCCLLCPVAAANLACSEP